jgi:hypothetical protein
MQRSVPDGTGLDLPPELAMFGEQWSMILALETLLTPEARTTCPSCSAAGHLIDEKIRGRPCAVPQLPYIPPGVTADDVAGIIAAQLARGAHTATTVFAALMSCQIRLESIGPHTRQPRDSEARNLRLRRGDPVYVREGRLMAGTVICAEVSLRLNPQHVALMASGVAWGRIRSGEPAGDVLAPFGMTPGRRRIEIEPGTDLPVRAWRVLTIRNSPVAIATEDVPLAFCQLLADPGR